MPRQLVGLVAIAWMAAVVSAVAQQRPTPDPAALAAARQMLAATRSSEQFEVVLKSLMRPMAEAVKQQHPAHAATIDDVFAHLQEKFSARKGEAIELVAPLYAERFTVSEMNDIIIFYHSPVGQKVLQAMPELVQRSMAIGMAWGQRIGDEVEQEARLELQKRGVPI